MLEMGLLPATSSATSAYMILFTSAAASMQYAVLGALRSRHAVGWHVAQADPWVARGTFRSRHVAQAGRSDGTWHRQAVG